MALDPLIAYTAPNYYEIHFEIAIPSTIDLTSFIPLILLSFVIMILKLNYTTTKPTHAKGTSFLLVALALACCVSPCAAPPTRNNPGSSSDAPIVVGSGSSIPIGSDSYPNMIKDWDFLPGMNDGTDNLFMTSRVCGG